MPRSFWCCLRSSLVHLRSRSGTHARGTPQFLFSCVGAASHPWRDIAVMVVGLDEPSSIYLQAADTNCSAAGAVGYASFSPKLLFLFLQYVFSYPAVCPPGLIFYGTKRALCFHVSKRCSIELIVVSHRNGFRAAEARDAAVLVLVEAKTSTPTVRPTIDTSLTLINKFLG